MENYNNNSTGQLSISFQSIDKIISIINQSIIENNEKSNSFKILDIGSSHGKNSILFINHILTSLKPQLSQKLIEIYHSDLEINDFTELFKEINKEIEFKNSYKNVFSFAIGNSFMNQLMPNETCDLIFSFNCLYWANSTKFEFINSDSVILTSKILRTPEMEKYCLERFPEILNKRYNELKPCGIFICNLIFFNKKQCNESYFEAPFKNINNILRKMANEGILLHSEVDKIVVPALIYESSEVEDGIKFIEEKGMKCIHNEKYDINWGKSIKNPINDSCKFVDSCMAFLGPFIKCNMIGDKNRIDSIYKEFYNRFKKEYKECSNNFDFSFAFNLLIFKKKIN